MEKIVIDKIDKGCLPTIAKYIPEQLIGAIIKYISTGDNSSFTDDYGSRAVILGVGVSNFKQALLEHVVKFDAAFGITATRYVQEFGKNYNAHSVGETELRLFETLSLSVDDVFNKTAVYDALLIINNDGKALYNVVKSFVEYRYVKSKIGELESAYLKSVTHKEIIWKIDEYFKTIN